jgi:galactonate dehydratase
VFRTVTILPESVGRVSQTYVDVNQRVKEGDPLFKLDDAQQGQALGVPVYELLGGAFRDGIPVYANAWFTGARTADEFAERARAAVASGFTGLKWDPFGSTYGDLLTADISRCERIVACVREAVGPDIDLMIEGHGRFDLPTALRLCDMLLPYAPKWFEEPLPPESLRAYSNLCARASVPIATGERYCVTARFSDLLSVADVAYIQPDVVHVGGVSALKQIAATAYTDFVPTAPHNPAGPVANAMSSSARPSGGMAGRCPF